LLQRLPLRLLSAPALAQELTGTLKKIKETGVITLGHRESSIPFSYYDDKQQVVGYSQEMMLKAVDAIKAELKLAKLDVKLCPSPPRIASRSSRTAHRRPGMRFDDQHHRASETGRLLEHHLRRRQPPDGQGQLGDQGFSDLAGKNVVTTAGTTSERLLRKMNESSNMKMKIISAKDHGEAFLTLESGRAAAFVMDEVLLYGELAKAKNASDWAVVGTPQLYQAYACMMRKDDPAFKKSRRWRARQGDDLGRSRQDLRQVVPAADPAEGPEPQLPDVVRPQEAVQITQRQGLRLGQQGKARIRHRPFVY
jgi:glutamate/aspartate transport system substrate-binding protein